MKRRLRSCLLITVILALLLAGCKIRVTDRRVTDDSDAGSVFMWEVKADEGDGRLFLLGSIHVVHEGMYPLNTVITDAFENSDVLAVECDAASVFRRKD